MNPLGLVSPARHRSIRSTSAAFCCLALAVTGCERTEQQQKAASLQLEHGTVQLPAGTQIHEVRVAAARDRDAFEPDSLTVRTGDVVRFVAGDALTHALTFDMSQLDSAVLEFLHRSQQLASPPLLSSGSAWIVSLEGAPPGDYPFTCRQHGNGGLLRVE